MEIFKTVVSDLKSESAEKLKSDLLVQNYGLKFCTDESFISHNMTKLEIIFLSNICYLKPNQRSIDKLLTRNYKNLYSKKNTAIDTDIDLVEETTIINNYTINKNIVENNYITNNTIEDYWDQTDY